MQSKKSFSKNLPKKQAENNAGDQQLIEDNNVGMDLGYNGEESIEIKEGKIKNNKKSSSGFRKKTVDSNDLVDTCSQLKEIDLIKGFQFAQTNFNSKELKKTFSKFLFDSNRFELISSLVSKFGTSSLIDNFFRGTSESSLADSFFSIIFFNQKARVIFLDLEFEYLETYDKMSALFNYFSLRKVQKSTLVKDVFNHQIDDQSHLSPEKDLILDKLCWRKKNMHLGEFLKGFYDNMLFFSL